LGLPFGPIGEIDSRHSKLDLQIGRLLMLGILPAGVCWTFKSEVKEKMNNCSTRFGALFVAAYNKYKDRKWFPDPYIGPPPSKDDSAFEEWRTGASSLSPTDYWVKYKTRPWFSTVSLKPTVGPVLTLLFCSSEGSDEESREHSLHHCDHPWG
jgi:hypothetical protein